MNSETKQVEKGFLGKWVLFTSIAWPLGLIVSIIMAYVVNLVYPRETNLVVGIFVGAVVGLAQWLALRKRITLSGRWILFCAIGMGVPFIVATILDEAGIQAPDSDSAQLLARIVFGIIGGLLIGLQQVRSLKPHSTKAAWWILSCATGWGFCWLASSISGPLGALIGLLAGGIVLGLITGIALSWMLKFPARSIEYPE